MDMRKTAKALVLTVFLVSLSVASAQRGAQVLIGKAKTDAERVVAGNSAFALDLYARLRGQEGNLFFSPFSLSTALAMTYAGAGGETAMQISHGLHLPSDGMTVPVELGGRQDMEVVQFVPWEQERLHAAFGALVEDMNARQQGGHYRLSVANALWGQKGYGFLDEFLAVTRSNYGAGLREVDFAGDTEGARKTINEWVEQQTQDRIKDLVPPGVLDALTRLALTNAIYFKGDWAAQFDPEVTAEAPFTLSDGKKLAVQMMRQTGTFGYLEAPAFQALDLPYRGGDLSMIVLLPREPDGLTALEELLTPQSLGHWLGSLRKREVQVFLPRFTMASQFSLVDVLETMGMTDAFDANAADLSGMNGQRNLHVTAVIHKAFVEVNEEGTEAAAATGVAVGVTSIGPMPVIFRADRPFFLLIRDNATGSILFLGRLAELPGRA
jgi:serpin B